jgi:Uma2 family endonuclease
MAARSYEELVPVPRSAVRLPLEMALPNGFVADDPTTWPLVEGQLEFVAGKLLYMPPTADRQQDTTVDVVAVLANWRRAHTDYVVGTNEAGMILGGEVRAADAAVWRRADVGDYEGRFRRVPPVLAVEVRGELETDASLQEKARWYVDRGVAVVWLVFPRERRVAVITQQSQLSFGPGQMLPPSSDLPGLTPSVDELFLQVGSS